MLAKILNLSIINLFITKSIHQIILKKSVRVYFRTFYTSIKIININLIRLKIRERLIITLQVLIRNVNYIYSIIFIS